MSEEGDTVRDAQFDRPRAQVLGGSSACPNGAAPAKSSRSSPSPNAVANASRSSSCPFHGSMRASIPTRSGPGVRGRGRVSRSPDALGMTAVTASARRKGIVESNVARVSATTPSARGSTTLVMMSAPTRPSAAASAMSRRCTTNGMRVVSRRDGTVGGGARCVRVNDVGRAERLVRSRRKGLCTQPCCRAHESSHPACADSCGLLHAVLAHRGDGLDSGEHTASGPRRYEHERLATARRRAASARGRTRRPPLHRCGPGAAPGVVTARSVRSRSALRTAQFSQQRFRRTPPHRRRP